MARIDKVVATGRTYAALSLTLALTATVVAVGEAKRWLALSHARQTIAYWTVCDFLEEAFEDQWLQRKVEKRPVTDVFEPPRELENGNENYYSGFGAALVKRAKSGYSIAVKQPSKLAPLPGDFAHVPDLRAEIPDLLPWSQWVATSEALRSTLAPLSKSEAAVEIARMALNEEFKRTNPRKAARLPAWLQDEWSADSRWLTLRSEKERVELQLEELLKAEGISREPESHVPAPYRQLERSVIASEIRIPIIDLEMPTSAALWTLAGMVFLVSVLLAATLEGLEIEALPHREELWLLLDSHRGSPAALAGTWLVLLVLAPIVVPLFGIAYLFLRLLAGDSVVVSFVTVSSVLGLLAVAGGWYSCSAVGRLRAARSASLASERATANHSLQRTRRKATRR